MSLMRDVMAMLMPTIDTLSVQRWMLHASEAGTEMMVMGISPAERRDGSMTEDRLRFETAELFRHVTGELRSASPNGLGFAVEHEPWGIQRLHQLVPPYARAEANQGFEANSAGVALSATLLGINLFLGPVIEVSRGHHPHRFSRRLDVGLNEMGPIAASYIRGTQCAGVHAAVKYFPGSTCAGVGGAAPSVDELSASGEWKPERLRPFLTAINAGVHAIVLGSDVIEELDPTHPASTSRRTVSLLRDDLNFDGLILSDELASASMRQHGDISDTATAAIRAGVDLLWAPGGEQLSHIARGVAAAARADATLRDSIARSATRVRSSRARTSTDDPAITVR
ncbi:glycoside hydrolase family 3 N-terminal domain-containing protein [Leucobacter musarum]|uniref:glycoside hydrolase family 3 N-terminal domain-containing protein n=1 Tax=Leucobacter musarum TaxID=1930747 RepID=UPI0006A7A63A|nr:glycoside hydrolase family 3 N-terminal domain-containing protein [Leucobacter musarum]